MASTRARAMSHEGMNIFGRIYIIFKIKNKFKKIMGKHKTRAYRVPTTSKPTTNGVRVFCNQSLSSSHYHSYRICPLQTITLSYANKHQALLYYYALELSCFACLPQTFQHQTWPTKLTRNNNCTSYLRYSRSCHHAGRSQHKRRSRDRSQHARDTPISTCHASACAAFHFFFRRRKTAN